MEDVKVVERFDDMSRRDRLRLIRQEDGDVCVSIIPESGTGMADERRRADRRDRRVSWSLPEMPFASS